MANAKNHGALIRNERAKLYKKPSTWVLAGIVVAMSLVGLVLSHFISSVSYSQSSWQENYTWQIESYKNQLDDMKENSEERPSVQAGLDTYRYLLENDIPPSDWRTDVAHAYFQSLADSQNAALSGNEADTAKTQADSLKAMLDKNDWRAYVKYQMDTLKAGASNQPSNEVKVQLDIYQIYLDQGIVPLSADNGYYGGEEASADAWKSKQVEIVKQNKLNLLRGSDDNDQPLSSAKRQGCENAINVALKRLSSDTPPIDDESFLGLLESALSSTDMLAILLIVLAGGAISTEFSTGTIKLLLITPHRRSRVFWAKARLMLEVTLLCLGAIFVLSFLLSGIFTGFDNLGAMQVISLFGQTVRMPYLAYIVMNTLIFLLPVLTYGALALMLSTVVRKSAVAIAFTMILMFGSSIFVTLLSAVSNYIVIPGIKFLLFTNTSLDIYLPSAATAATGYVMSPPDNTMTLGFSLAVLAAYLVCFLWIARDSFCRRDVK